MPRCTRAPKATWEDGWKKITKLIKSYVTVLSDISDIEREKKFTTREVIAKQSAITSGTPRLGVTASKMCSFVVPRTVRVVRDKLTSN